MEGQLESGKVNKGCSSVASHLRGAALRLENPWVSTQGFSLSIDPGGADGQLASLISWRSLVRVQPWAPTHNIKPGAAV